MSFSGPWDSNNLNNDKKLQYKYVKKYEKNCKFCQKMLKFMIAKSSKPFHCHYKLCSNLLSNPRGGFMTPKAKKTQKMTKIFKKPEKNCKN